MFVSIQVLFTNTIMKNLKHISVSFCFLFLVSKAGAQLTKETPKLFEVGLMPVLEIPLGNFAKVTSPAIGISLKGAYNLRSGDQVTIRVGYTGFGVKDLPVNYSSTYSSVPVLVGYRLGVSKAFLEAQAGIGFYSLRLSDGTSEAKSNQTTFTYAFGGGYDFGRIELISRFQQGKFEGTNAGSISMLTLGMYYKLL